MTTVARHTSHCPECPEPIEPGQRIAETDDGWAHESCAIPRGQPVEYPTCTSCWLIHAPGACDQ